MMIRIALLLLCLATPLQAEVYPALHDVTGVADDDVLNIREAPDAEAPVIGTLAPDATGVEVIGASDGWALVNSGERGGYVNMRYLARSDGPDWTALESPLTCLGTEPFWSLQIDPARNETRYLTPEDPETRVAPITTRWPGLPWSSIAAVSLPEGLAVLTPADCSDGMSELSYGIAIDIFLQLEGAPRLSGCCRLGLP